MDGDEIQTLRERILCPPRHTTLIEYALVTLIYGYLRRYDTLTIDFLPAPFLYLSVSTPPLVLAMNLLGITY